MILDPTLTRWEEDAGRDTTADARRLRALVRELRAATNALLDKRDEQIRALKGQRDFDRREADRLAVELYDARNGQTRGNWRSGP